MNAKAPVVVRESPLDWVKFDALLARDGTVDPVDKALYAALSTFVDKGPSRLSDDDPDGADVPTRKVLAACIGRDVRAVDRATARLEKRGLIEVERRRDPDNPRVHLPSVYHLLDQHRWDDRAAERSAARKARKGSVTGDARGGVTSDARGTDDARGSDTSDAVPYSSSEDLSPEGAGARADGPEHSSSADDVTEEREHFEDQEHDAVASAAPSATDLDSAESVVTAFVDARPGVPVSAATRATIQAGAETLLGEGVNVERLRVVAADMAVRGAGRWTDLARHAERNGSLLAVPAPRTQVGGDFCTKHRGLRLIDGECQICAPSRARRTQAAPAHA